ncbi:MULTISPECIES: GNAT family N-acetyltransferase [Actinoalloteichus]|uniref:Acetyltransferase (GNAT) family protein n=1 Tax=Actinoalloteichus fjordicus TaxID=1612552 RepID=A0AAC9LL27_9PSEU|nr:MULTISPECIES: GNAT family N-acetyltransferase [Actinoalloteichus]APU18044.1 acetyltransferase (GNAT) family protein [Actinoalloteichus fjordicus]APU24123.1 acetyltransferase (GNAT) family protein [Actinoalloteichus sp. GBA129-24]
MSRSVVGITLDNLHELPKQCRRCVFWELAPHIREQAEEFGQTEFEKEAWISSVLLEWGSCGRLVRVGGVPAGYALYAPPSAVPRSGTFPTSPVSADAVLLTTLKVMPEFADTGLGRLLVQAVAKDLTRRGVKAVEAFGYSDGESDGHCVIPAEFLRQVGFKTVRPHPRWPRLRLELRSAFTWKEDVEAALERLLEPMTVSTDSASSTSVGVPAR